MENFHFNENENKYELGKSKSEEFEKLNNFINFFKLVDYRNHFFVENNFFVENKCDFDMNKYFYLDQNRLVPYCETDLENISISALLIFGKANIRLQDVHDLLELVRFREVKITSSIYPNYHVDNYVVDYNDESFINIFKNSNKKYAIKIESDSFELDEMNFYTDPEIKYCIAVQIVSIMEHVNPTYLNHHNYNIFKKYIENPTKNMYKLINKENLRRNK